MPWFKDPDIVGGWKTNNEPSTKPGDFSPADFSQTDFATSVNVSGFGENQSNNMLELDGTGFFTHPLDYQINDPHQQFYPVGLMPVGLDISARAMIGINPFSPLPSPSPPIPPASGIFVLGSSKLGGPDVLG